MKFTYYFDENLSYISKLSLKLIQAVCVGGGGGNVPPPQGFLDCAKTVLQNADETF